MRRTQKRYKPVSSTNESTFQMNMARLSQGRSSLNDSAINNSPTAENPLNFRLNADVVYSEKPRLTQTSRVLQKYENMNPRPNDVALYNTKNMYTQLNAEEKIGTYLRDQLDIRTREKILQSTAAHNCSGYNYAYDLKSGNLTTTMPEAGNGTAFNPLLPYSNNNQPHVGMAPEYVDRRMEHKTPERAWTTESDRIRIAADLQRSSEIIERNRRQEETDRKLLHRALIPNRTEPKLAYETRAYDPRFSLDEYVTRSAGTFSERRALSDNQAREAFAHSRIEFDEATSSKLREEIDTTFSTSYNRHQKQVLQNEISKSRIEQFNPDIHSMKPKGFFETMVGVVHDSVSSILFTKKHSADYDVRLQYDGGEDMFRALDSGVETEFEALPERYYYKPDHYVMMKTGDIPDVFPDDIPGETAYMHIAKDPVGHGIVRTIVVHNKDYISVIQKRAGDNIFGVDNMPYGDDCIEMEIPLEYFNKTFRDKISLNQTNDRARVVELEYNDFAMFNEILESNMELQTRLKPVEFKRKLRDIGYTNDVFTEYENKKSFVDETVYSGIASNARRAVTEKYTGRIDKHQIDVADVPISNVNPYKQQQIHGRGTLEPGISTRSKGVNLRQFN